ncbi:hypothetical protein GCM10009641_11800 [Mycobacterium cookii]|uniref:Alpha/beta hydrolase n=1 Tax=Mycobacterium cookii TaxID=1775 RepID=A0A7I7KY30_9MYCO|nr:hypothetical protein [Mycobacterium cookii]MCV7331681.1 hypothetical protein [Mycobacterium cookii]BBX46980.1 hypothetical protein MCOO_29950 [Mycobacterium cookii]
MDSARLHRILADGLARRGFAVLHFDYLGLGDSAYAQDRDDAVANWVASVGHALDYLTLVGAQSTTAIGIRAGCLIVDEYLNRSHTVNRVVLLDPPGTGRRYLREHTALFRLSVGEDAVTAGEVSIMGGRLTDHAAGEFAALQLSANPVSTHGVDNVLLVGRPAETDRRVTALASSEGVDSIVSEGLPDCARPRDMLLPIPYAAVDSIVEWIDRHVSNGTHRAVPQYLDTVTMPADGPDGVDVIERIERIGPNGLFAIRTLPRRRSAAPARTVLFFVTAKDFHVGPAREWVELSRRIAASGAQAMRWDPAGMGLSGRIHRDPYRFVFTKADITDAIAVARHACHDVAELELVGICSGSWYAAQVVRNVGARSAILVNLVAWSWRITPNWLSQWDIRRKALRANAPRDTGGSHLGSWTARLRAPLAPARGATKSFMHNHLPRSVLHVLSWIGLVYLPESVLTTLVRRGTDLTLIAAPEDTEHFLARGGQGALDRLQETPQPPRRIAIPTGDHGAHHPMILAAIRNAVLPAMDAATAEDREILWCPDEISAREVRAG